MALKPTIFRVQVALADSDRGCFETLSLTLAQHPSETRERLLVRLLVFCLNQAPGLSFTRGLSSGDEPDIWRHGDSGELEQWLEVGQPEEARLRKACGRARQVGVYAFGAGATTWWQQQGPAICRLPRLAVWQFDWREVTAAAAGLQRTARLSLSVVGGVLYLDNGDAACSLEPRELYRAD